MTLDLNVGGKDNADELKDDLVLEYNRSRQRSITDELIEIVAGSV